MEEIFSFLQKLDAVHPLSNALKNDIAEKSEIINLQKKTILFTERQTVKYLYLVIKGICRSYYTHDGTEITSNFVPEGQILFCANSYYNAQPEKIAVNAIEDCVIAKIKFSDIALFFNKYAEFNFIARYLAHQYIIQTDQRLFLLRKLSTKEKWDYFQQYYPDYVLRIPLGYIATYLGMNLETLSRMRKG